MTPLPDIFNQPSNAKVLVLGDLMLDRYVWGDVDRISPESPVPVLSVRQEEVRLGGAASVAGLLRALEAEPILVGILGDDPAGRTLAKVLDEAAIERRVVVLPLRPTTCKERYIGRAGHRHPQQLLRVDREESHPLDPASEDVLLKEIGVLMPSCAAVLISDYSKGVCTPRLLQETIACAHRLGKPVLIDPGRHADYEWYRGADALTPNRSEAGAVVGYRIHDPDRGLNAAADISRRYGIGCVIVKLDSQGMVLHQRDGTSAVLPTQAREVYDVTGAGDMVLAVLGWAAASGLAWREAAVLANLAAGLEVEKWGVTPVTRAELRRALHASAESPAAKHVSLDEMAALAEEYRSRGKRVVFTNGCFDLLHVGHVNYLREAAALGHVLVVAVNSDAGVRRLKGPSRPVIGETDRAALLAALSCVDHVLVFEEDTPHEFLRRIRPDVLVKGGTYTVEGVVGREIVETYGGQVCVVGAIPGVSTTDILSRAREMADNSSN